MQENNDLKFKTLQIANYLVNRFNTTSVSTLSLL